MVKFLDDVNLNLTQIATGSPNPTTRRIESTTHSTLWLLCFIYSKTSESTQLWVGNMNKYHIFNGELYNASKTIRLIKADGSLDAAAKGLWTDEGMKGQLPFGFRH